MIEKLIEQAERMSSQDFIYNNGERIVNIDGGFEACCISFWVEGKFVFIEFVNYLFQSYSTYTPSII